MVKITREIVHKLRTQGKTYTEIGQMFDGLTRQRVWNIYTGYPQAYRKTEKYKTYNRHMKHQNAPEKRYKPCELCDVNKQSVNTAYN